MAQKGRRSRPLSASLVLGSFFGALMVAVAFAYYNYTFAQYKFIDFSEFILYEQSDLFTPKHEIYNLIFYNSKNDLLATIKAAKGFDTTHPILAIDFGQNKFANDANITYVTAPTNTLLAVIQRFNIYKVPVSFLIKRDSKESLYKQHSMIQQIE